MEIINFTADYIEQATQIVKQNYLERYKYIFNLPEIVTYPDLISLAQNGLGVAAFENNIMLGFLTCFSPLQNAFGSTDAIGVFSPIHGNGTVPENRAKIYAYMYQEAAKKWIENGATSHAICLYAHNEIAKELFFQYGFGLRCIDAIRNMEEIETQAINNIFFSELHKESFSLILPFNKLLIDHLKQSPTFYKHPIDDDTLLDQITMTGNRYFIAKKDNDIVAYLKISEEGENFISDNKHVMNVCGAFCLPKYRGNGLFLNLLNFTIKALRNEGYTLLGVDFESFNPTAHGFWLKYFTAYTYSVVRRIDEYVLK